MSAQASTTQAQAQLIQQSQENKQRILRAVTLGLKYLEDGDVNGPMKYADAVTDLKWLLRQLTGGVFNINLDPSGELATASDATGGTQGKKLSEYDHELEDKDKSNSGDNSS